jgi:hypothetical protein
MTARAWFSTCRRGSSRCRHPQGHDRRTCLGGLGDRRARLDRFRSGSGDDRRARRRRGDILKLAPEVGLGFFTGRLTISSPAKRRSGLGARAGSRYLRPSARLRGRRPLSRRVRSSCWRCSTTPRPRNRSPLQRSETATCSRRSSASWRPSSMPEAMIASRISLLGASTRMVTVVRPSASVNVTVFSVPCSGPSP